MYDMSVRCITLRSVLYTVTILAMSRPSQGALASRPVGDGSTPYPLAFLIHDLQPGGAEQVYVTYVNGVEAIAPTAVLVRRRPGLEGLLAERVRLFDLEAPDGRSVRPEPAAPRVAEPRDGRTLDGVTGPIALVRKAMRLRTLLEREGIGAVSTFLHKSHAIALFLKLFVTPELRVVVNVHETPSQHIPRHFGPLGRILMTLLTRYALPRADLIVAVADGVERDLVEGYGVPRERVVVVRNPIAGARILGGARAPVDDAFVDSGGGPLVVAVGRLVALKGFDVLLDAFARVPAEARARLVIVGDGPERVALDARVRALGLEDSVRLVGYDANPWRYVARADLFVLSSLTEALPGVVAEALVLGVPVVAADCAPGISELLGDGDAGVLAPPGDAVALADRLAALLADPEERARLAAGAARRGRALLDGDPVRSYERVVLSALRGGRPTR